MVPIMWKIPTKPWFLRGCLILGGRDQSLICFLSIINWEPYRWKTRGTFGCSWSPEGGKVDRANDDLTMEISEDSSIINVM